MSDTPSFTVDLFPTGDEGAAFHVKNAPGGEIQRTHLMDSGSNLLMQGELLQVIHGKLAPNDAPATLTVLSFNFHSMALLRRFRAATITLQFADANNRANWDPEVIGIAPHGHFSMNLTQKSEEVTHSAALSVQSNSTVAGVTAGYGWGRTESLQKQDQTTLRGAIRLEGRDYGPPNTVRWVLMENVTQKSGIPTKLRVAVLLKRKSFVDRFVATIRVKADLDIISAFQGLFGRSPRDDPVMFDPSQPPTSHGFDLENLKDCDLMQLCEVLSTTMLKTVVGG